MILDTPFYFLLNKGGIKGGILLRSTMPGETEGGIFTKQAPPSSQGIQFSTLKLSHFDQV